MAKVSLYLCSIYFKCKLNNKFQLKPKSVGNENNMTPKSLSCTEIIIMYNPHFTVMDKRENEKKISITSLIEITTRSH